jgi:PqqD family protein of HPr-rel-A system
VEQQRKWRVLPSFELHWRDDPSWGDSAVVFHPGSGDTHLLNPLAAEALHALSESPLDAGELTQHLALRMEGASSELAAQLRQLLQEFDDLGLIEPAP